MLTKVTMPKLGLTMKTGTVVEWMKKEGDFIQKGMPLYSIDTQKVIVDIESPATGVLRRIFATKGTTFPIGALLAVIADPNEPIPDLEQLTREATVQPDATVTDQHRASERTVTDSARDRDKIPISPSARKLAREHNIDVSKIAGTGHGGRIQREDVLKAIEIQGPSSPQAPEAEEIQLTPMRLTMVERLTSSYTNALHVTLQTEADFTELKVFREKFGQEGRKIPSYTDILVKAAAIMLSKIRLLNSTFDATHINLMKGINVGIAVALKDGLVVPVLRNADQMKLEEIARRSEILIEKARSGKLDLEDVTGGTFTITNLGMYDIDSFSPIINPPEAAILAVGRIVDKPAVVNGQICIRTKGTLTLTFDHRIIDGAGAADFLGRLGRLLTEPSLLI